MKLRNERAVRLNDAIKKTVDSFIVDAITILNILWVSEINTRQGGVVQHQATKDLLHLATINIVIF